MKLKLMLARFLYWRWRRLSRKMWGDPMLLAESLLSEGASEMEDLYYQEGVSVDMIMLHALGEAGFACKVFAHPIPND